MKILFWILVGAVGLYLVMLIYLYFVQKSLVFFPSKDFIATPDALDLKYENLNFELDGKSKIHGWYFPNNNDTISAETKAVLFCHGNAGNISMRFPTIELFNELNIPFLIFDYRGFGQSTGELSEQSTYDDAKRCYDFLVRERNFKPENIIIFGRSLGGAVATELAKNEKCGGLILESTFSSAKDAGARIFPIFPIKILLKYNFDSKNKIGQINCPLLVIHSPEDDIIPYDMGEKLFELGREPKTFLKISGLHNERHYLKTGQYVQTLKTFIGE